MQTLRTNIFTVEKNVLITKDFLMGRATSLSRFFTASSKIDIVYPTVSDSITGPGLIGKELPSFELNGTSGSISNFSLRGKPTLLTFINTWLPQSAEQFSVLSELVEKAQFNIVVIVPHESSSKTQIYKQRGGYDLSIYADQDGELVEPLKLNSFPTHVFVDRKGFVQDLKVGVLDEASILESLF